VKLAPIRAYPESRPQGVGIAAPPDRKSAAIRRQISRKCTGEFISNSPSSAADRAQAALHAVYKEEA
jgi:Tfp pilus assembly protein PilZ